MMDVKLNLEYVTSRENKNGQNRYYFRKRGRLFVRLPDNYKSAEFMCAYNAILNEPALNIHAQKGTFAWLSDEYQESTAFHQLAVATKKSRRRIINTMIAELVNPEHKQTFGQTKVTSFTKKHITVLRDRKRDAPNAANERLKVLNAMFKHATNEDLIDLNPCSGSEKLSIPRGGHQTATDEQLQQYLDYHKSGPARLAMRLLMATGARGSDLRLQCLPNLKGSILSFTTVKTGMLVEIDIGTAFAEELRAAKNFVFLNSNISSPYKSDKSLSQSISTWFKQADIEGITAHSVRKWLATRMANEGVDEFGLMAFFGWRDSKEAKPYTQTYNRKKAAQKAVDRITHV